ncbi:MAG: DDE-type integrase/transposase/recombinase [Chitinophagaceae bacterium]|nr:DDE-type integrase/transposase/recombinase [Chitinophagaceae bacterium]MCA6447551.1 DDE-type integrase/transposase/recombinase [Chitinophagaceae bacterium]
MLNEAVITSIKGILGEEFVCYGYQKVTVELKEQNYIINAKKVYRLMDENKLLLGKVIRTSGKRLFVQHRKIVATYPMECLCLDIKYVWVYGEQRWYYLLSVIDVYSRKIIAHVLQRSIKQLDVINLFRKINAKYPIKGVTIRNDNGAQFIANSVKQYLQSAEAKQEFTHIANPRREQLY